MTEKFRQKSLRLICLSNMRLRAFLALYKAQIPLFSGEPTEDLLLLLAACQERVDKLPKNNTRRLLNIQLGTCWELLLSARKTLPEVGERYLDRKSHPLPLPRRNPAGKVRVRTEKTRVWLARRSGVDGRINNANKPRKGWVGLLPSDDEE